MNVWTGSPKRVLLLDDEPLLVRALSRMLRNAGFVVDGAHDTTEALAFLAREEPDIVVTDLHISSSCGVEFLRAVARMAPNAIRVLMSADIDFRPKMHALGEARAHTLIGKTELRSLPGILIGHLRSRLEMPSTDADRIALAMSVAHVLARPDHEDDGHRDRLSRWTMCVAKEMSLRDEEIADARLGAILHDVGQMAVPPLYFSRPGALRMEERAQLELHPGVGADLVSAMPSLRRAQAVVATHHERHDGGGYPSGMSGDEIPSSTRAFQVVDAYDAMRRGRPYRLSMTHGEAMLGLEKGAGRHHDGDAVRALHSLGEEGLAAALVA